MTSPYRPRHAATALPLLLLLGLSVARAQTQAENPATAPDLPTQLHYQSVLPSGARSSDPEPRGWVAANARVDAIGGWRAYAREVMTGVPAGKALDGETAQPAGAAAGMQMPMHMKGHGQ